MKSLRRSSTSSTVGSMNVVPVRSRTIGAISKDSFAIGDFVKVVGTEYQGVVRFFGIVHFSTGSNLSEITSIAFLIYIN